MDKTECGSVNVDVRHIQSRFFCGKTLDLDYLESRLNYTEYDRGLKSLVIHRKMPEKCTAQVYPTGRVIVHVTSVDTDLVKKRCRQIARLIQRSDHQVKFKNYSLLRIQASVKLDYCINLVNFAKSDTRIMFEPELGPEIGSAAAHFTMDYLSTSFVIYRTGKLTIYCSSNVPELAEAVNLIEKKLILFKI